MKANGFLVMAHGPAAEMARAKTILGTAISSQIDVHGGTEKAPPAVVAAG